jgi:hypothetical protein
MFCQHDPCGDCDDECRQSPGANTRAPSLALSFQLRFAGEASSARARVFADLPLLKTQRIYYGA